MKSTYIAVLYFSHDRVYLIM